MDNIEIILNKLFEIVIGAMHFFIFGKNHQKKYFLLRIYSKKMIPSGIEPLIPALLAPCLNQLGQGIRSLHFPRKPSILLVIMF